MPKQEPTDSRKTLMTYTLILLGFLFVFNFLVLPWMVGRQVREVSYTEFLDRLEAEEVTQVELKPQENSLMFVVEDEQRIYRTAMVEDPMLTARLYDQNVDFKGSIIEPTSPFLTILLTWVIPFGILFLVGRFLTKKMSERMGASGGLSFGGNSKARVYVKSDEGGVTFNDVAGVEEAKESLYEIVDYLNNPGKYAKIGAKMPKGVLLIGPPGTGKTLLARAIAGESDVPFFSIAGSEFVEMFAGLGASKVRDLFEQAKKKAPCIVFIDEIDAIGQKRDGRIQSNDEREQTLNQLLTEMDGFEDNTGVVLLAATNRPDSLDPALTRPGRFDRRVPVELPDLYGREAILKVHAKDVVLERGIDFHRIARMTPGASGAELANIINEAALRAVREGRSMATQVDIEESIEIVIAGQQKKNAILSNEEKKTVAYHEVGHALIAAMQTGSAPVEKITIIPRTSGALGYTLQVQEEGDTYLMTKETLEDMIAVLTGGRAAEDVAIGKISTGAANDIERATNIARAMVTRYGMSDNFGMVQLEDEGNRYLGSPGYSNCSAETHSQIDREVVAIIETQYDRAKTTLRENRAKLDELAKYLYEEETINGAQFMDILQKPTPEPSDEAGLDTEVAPADEASGEAMEELLGLSEPEVSELEDSELKASDIDPADEATGEAMDELPN